MHQKQKPQSHLTNTITNAQELVTSPSGASSTKHFTHTVGKASPVVSSITEIPTSCPTSLEKIEMQSHNDATTSTSMLVSYHLDWSKPYYQCSSFLEHKHYTDIKLSLRKCISACYYYKNLTVVKVTEIMLHVQTFEKRTPNVKMLLFLCCKINIMFVK